MLYEYYNRMTNVKIKRFKYNVLGVNTLGFLYCSIVLGGTIKKPIVLYSSNNRIFLCCPTLSSMFQKQEKYASTFVNSVFNWMFRLAQHRPREHKNTLGTKLNTQCFWNMYSALCFLNSVNERTKCFQENTWLKSQYNIQLITTSSKSFSYIFSKNYYQPTYMA